MKKKLLSVLLLSCCVLLSGCSTDEKEDVNAQKNQKETAQQENNVNNNDSNAKENKEEQMERKLVLIINNASYDITLYDTPAANALYDMLPLDLTFEDFNNIEKIAYLEGTLPTEDEPDGFDPNIGDLCLYAPWGNLSIFYKDFRYSDSLISLGHIDEGTEEISNIQDNFTARLEVKK